MFFERIPLQEISTLSILVPLVMSLPVLRTGALSLRLFFLFLLTGLATDGLGWWVAYHHDHWLYLQYAFTLYSCLESLFFLWFIGHHAKAKTLRRLARALFVATVIWFLYVFLIEGAGSGETSHSYFDPVYLLTVSFLAGFALLQLVETEAFITPLPVFWLQTGIFFYGFSTFFIFMVKLIVGPELAGKIWFLHNLINITTYGLYTVGFWKAYVARQAEQP
ncbi:hypothetical protein [Chryseolinea lacunae]|uniref:Lysoplasmalogenase n=1 Tax=Chryseolinea lacunae TaxID=2801331 RepID=A0ABS1KUK6_9BACT|nr:hypothetical protein [Chryseolinea lacunae]MBL0741996.1 hypothetical protein [Chryseolinea lacunae]